MKILTQALTFDDVLLVPNYSEVLPKSVDLSTHLTEKIPLNTPILSAAMDTVTEHKMAIALAQEGGIGIIHKNFNAKKQAEEIQKVKKYESGVIQNPITITPDISIAQAIERANQQGISAMPVLDHAHQLVGIVTKRDLRFAHNDQDPLSSVMTPKEQLITVNKNQIEPEAVKQLLHQHRIERLLVVDNQQNLAGMITVKDIEKPANYPLANKDSFERLCVGAAVGVNDHQRIEQIIEADVDVIVVDTAHGHSKGVIDQIRWIKQHYPHVSVIGGNIATADAALALAKAGADAVKVGIGPGSICTTRVISGVGVPQITAILEVSQALKDHPTCVIADGGIRFSGDIAKAIAAGADCVMLGSMLAGTEEAPGEIEYYQGRAYKSYRGMGSLGAMREQHGSSDRYFQSEVEADKLVPEGIEGRVPFKGSVPPLIHQLIGGLRSSMGYCGAPSIADFQDHTRFVQITNAGINESHVHDVTITKEAPNYRI